MSGFRRCLYFIAIIIVACSEPISYPTRVIKRGVGLALTCVNENYSPLPLEDCKSSSSKVLAWVLDADLPGIALLEANSGIHIDSDLFIPGFTPISLSKDLTAPLDPVAIRAQPDSRAIFVLLRKQRAVVKIDTSKLPDATSLDITYQELLCVPAGFDIVWFGPAGPAVVVTCPGVEDGHSGLLVLPLDGQNPFGQMTANDILEIDVSGHPYLVTVSPDGVFAYLTQYPGGANYLSRVNLETHEEKKAGLVAECADGIDNDLDGKVDGADSDCLGPFDRSESGGDERRCVSTGNGKYECDGAVFTLNPLPKCSNGIDDDGDGRTDALDPDCYGDIWDDETGVAPPLVGRPAVSPDGAWIYVPMASPDVIRVFRKEPFEPVDITGPEGVNPNPALARIGIIDIPVPAPAAAIAMAVTADGTRAFAVLYSGELFELVVDDHGTPKHSYTPLDYTPFSTASPPSLYVNGVFVDRSSALHPEYPGLGPLGVSLVPGTTDKYSYYGIVFGDDLERQLTETWRITYEGVLPGTRSVWGFLSENGELEDPSADFCAAGVEPKDHVVIEASAECANGAIPEFAIESVGPDSLKLKPIEGGIQDFTCLKGAVTYEIRTSGMWTVVGSRSGFMHNFKAEGDKCVQRDLKDPLYDKAYKGRAFTSRPKQGDIVQACPPVVDESDIEWLTFDNGVFSFRIFPPCTTDENFVSRVVPVQRDTELRFSVKAGLTSKGITVGSLPLEPVMIGTTAYVFDAGGGYLVVVDTVNWNITSSHY